MKKNLATRGIPILLFLLFFAFTTAVQARETGKRHDTQRPGQRSAAQERLFDPMGWVTIGYDYDNDGTFDAYEVISVYELETRKQKGQSAASLGERKDFFERSSFLQDTKKGTRKNMGTVRGEITKLATVDILNSDRQHLVARVDTDRGTLANVDLGPAENLEGLNLQKGDVIKVFGVEGRIDQYDMLLANRLQASGQRVKIDRSGIQPLKKFEATVLKTREASHKGRTNMLARVKLEDGITTLVNLGPAKDLPKLAEGDDIRFLARLTEVKGKKALIADFLTKDGETYHIDWKSVQKSRGKDKA